MRDLTEPAVGSEADGTDGDMGYVFPPAPNKPLRVVYCSATGASEPRNLGYMTRLGLWGAAGSPFPGGFKDFLTAVEGRCVGETVCSGESDVCREGACAVCVDGGLCVPGIGSLWRCGGVFVWRNRGMKPSIGWLCQVGHVLRLLGSARDGRVR